MVDAICDKLYTPSHDAVENLLSENINKEKINNVGNIMIDTLTKNLDLIFLNLLVGVAPTILSNILRSFRNW